MGVDCKIDELESQWSLYSHYPAISTVDRDVALKYYKNYTYIPLGEVLSSALLKYHRDDRKDHVISELDGIFSILEAREVLIDDIDILFNPAYDIDILGYFVNIGRNRKLIVIWPGKYNSGVLSYALPGYDDYKIYTARNYNLICLV